MAGIPYNQGAGSDVAPNVQAPDDYERVQANPRAFGSAVAEGAEKLGSGLLQANQFFNASSADQATNNLVDEGTTLLHGDPNKVNPDGTRDTGLYGKQGQDFMDAYGAAHQQLQDLVKNHRENLPSGQAQLDYDRNSRRWLQINEAEMGRAYDAAQKAWMVSNNTVSAKQALDDISRSATNDKAFDGYLENLKTAYGKTSHIYGKGISGDQEAARDATRDGWKARLAAISVDDPAKAYQLAVTNRGLLGTEGDTLVKQYEKGAETASVKSGVAEGIHFSMGKSTSELSARVPGAPGGAYGPEFTQYNQHLNNGDVQSALRLSEGLRTNAYWDVNHWRTGYGSDTVTRPDGAVESVTAMTRITPEDAERDLQRRTALAAQTAEGTIGASQWAAMAPGTKAAMTSVVYNYGHVPSDIAAAARSGNPQVLAAAITNHAGDNAGVNFQRRRAEAGAVLGLSGNFGPGGPRVQPASFQIGGQSTPQAATEEPVTTEASSTGLQPATFTPTDAAKPLDAPPEPETPEEKLERLTLAKDASLQYALEHHPEWNDAQQREAQRQIELEFQRFTIATQMDAHTHKVQKDALGGKIASYMLNGRFDLALEVAHDQSNAYTPPERLAVQGLIEKESGMPDPATLGPKFHEIMSRVELPPGSPDRIGVGDNLKILQAMDRGDITRNGAVQAMEWAGRVQKSTDQLGVSERINGAIKTQVDDIVHEYDIGTYKVRDPQGWAHIEKYTNAIYSAANKWREEGKDWKDFPWFDPDYSKQQMLLMYPRRERYQAKYDAEARATPAIDVAKPAPTGTDIRAWNALMDKPPIIDNGQKIVYKSVWSDVAGDLLSHPDPDHIAAFNASEIGKASGMDAETLIQGMTGRPSALNRYEPGGGAGEPAPFVPGSGPRHAPHPVPIAAPTAPRPRIANEGLRPFSEHGPGALDVIPEAIREMEKMRPLPASGSKNKPQLGDKR